MRSTQFIGLSVVVLVAWGMLAACTSSTSAGGGGAGGSVSTGSGSGSADGGTTSSVHAVGSGVTTVGSGGW